MSSLTSASTMAAIENSLLDNASFEEDGSLTKAKAVVTAGLMWLIKRPQSASRDGNSLTLNAQLVQQMIDQARAYMAQASVQSGGVKFLTPGEFR